MRQYPVALALFCRSITQPTARALFLAEALN